MPLIDIFQQDSQPQTEHTKSFQKAALWITLQVYDTVYIRQLWHERVTKPSF